MRGVRGDGDTVPARARIAGAGAVRVSRRRRLRRAARELRRQGLAEERGALCGGAPSYAFDPAWVLPFALAGLRRGSLEARDAARWGLAGVAFAASASADETTRAVAFATLDALREACDETQRPEAADFRERAQLAALLQATRNGLKNEGAADREAVLGAAQARKRRCDDDEVVAAGLSRPADANKDKNVKNGSDQTSTEETLDSSVSDIARLPTATAVFAAEAATAALHPPATRTSSRTRGAPPRGAGRRGAPRELPGRAQRIGRRRWRRPRGKRRHHKRVAGRPRAPRLGAPAAPRQPAPRAGGRAAVPQAFAAEVLMSHRTAALSGDPRQASRARRRRARRRYARRRARARRGAGCWRGWRPPRAPPAAPQGARRRAAGARAAAAATATAALAELRRPRGAFYGGPAGTAADFLSAARDVRAALAPLFSRSDAGDAGDAGALARVARRCSPRCAARRPGAPNDAPAG